jgi:hypothetical protein
MDSDRWRIGRRAKQSQSCETEQDYRLGHVDSISIGLRHSQQEFHPQRMDHRGRHFRLSLPLVLDSSSPPVAFDRSREPGRITAGACKRGRLLTCQGGCIR